ncbi:MAG TPA: LacI family DNA-binding transcriptional regulator, partial [Blastocatellia bacterium]|nr:LacI family DNA-binding transcriptional regulator [Blastocatellia bacterium]
ARSIPESTKKRIVEAAKGLDYHPNPVARSLRAQRSLTLGVMVPELSDGYSAMVLTGIEDCLLHQGYFYLVVSHRHKDNLIDQYPTLFLRRRVEGIIAVDTPFGREVSVPVVAVSGHSALPNITTIKLNHKRAAQLALKHLTDLGHRELAFIKGQDFSSDTGERWQAIVREAGKLGLTVRAQLVAQLEGDSPSPEPGYLAAKKLLSGGRRFTALFAFNDVSAIGAIRALREAGLHVPDDISVVGFDDIYNASFFSPALTTIKQPLREMGRLAAETILKRLGGESPGTFVKEIVVEPELVIRQSTSLANLSNRAHLRAV